MTYTVAGCTVITPDNGQRNCPKHVEFRFQNKFEKLVQLVGFIIRRKWHLSVMKYKEVFTDKGTDVSEKPAASTLLDSKPLRNASYQSGITAPKTFAFINMAARN
jgi:hypothetical protein